MIDRLEELLEQVEETGEGEESLRLRQRPALMKAAGGQLPADEEEETAGGKKGSGGTSFPQENAVEEDVRPLFVELAHQGAGSGLEMLRHRLSRSLDAGSARAGSVAVVRETISPPAAGLTAGELDLAMRRDSRRYDGGMTIY